MKRQEPTAAHMAFREDLISLLNKHGGKLSSAEMLALAAHLVGQLAALQDQQTMTPTMAVELIYTNIQAGNVEAIDNLMDSKGTA